MHYIFLALNHSAFPHTIAFCKKEPLEISIKVDLIRVLDFVAFLFYSFSRLLNKILFFY